MGRDGIEAHTPPRYEAIALSDEVTVVAEFAADGVREAAYEGEADLERRLISQLEQQSYEHLRIASEAELLANLRRQLEKLNNLTFSDAEWERFFTQKISRANDSIIE